MNIVVLLWDTEATYKSVSSSVRSEVIAGCSTTTPLLFRCLTTFFGSEHGSPLVEHRSHDVGHVLLIGKH